jgi:hypothetical protein
MKCAGHVKTAPPSSAPLLTREEAAALLGVSVWSLAAWARDGVGPTYYRRGYSPRCPSAYRREDALQFKEQRRKPELQTVQLAAQG